MVQEASLRKEVFIVPPDGGRDAGRHFLISEMSAMRAEKWGLKFMNAVKGTAGFIPDEVARLGIVGIAIRGLNAILMSDIDFDKVEPLLDEMLGCVTIIRDRAHPEVDTPLLESDIFEVRTIGLLRSEVLRIHTGFSLTDALSALASVIKAGSMDPSDSRIM